MTITQEDRDAAAQAFFCKPLRNEKHNDDRRVKAFAAHRIAAEQRIVEWLRSDTGKGSEEGADWASTFADAIESGEHLPRFVRVPHIGEAS